MLGLDLEPIQPRSFVVETVVRLKLGSIVLATNPTVDGAFALDVPVANLPEGAQLELEIDPADSEPLRLPVPLADFQAGEKLMFRAVLRPPVDDGTGKMIRSAVVNVFRDRLGDGKHDGGVLLTVDNGVLDTDGDGKPDPVVRQTTPDGLMLFDTDGDGEFGEGGSGGDDAVTITPHPSSGRTRPIAGAVDVVLEDPAARSFPDGKTIQDTVAALAVDTPPSSSPTGSPPASSPSPPCRTRRSARPTGPRSCSRRTAVRSTAARRSGWSSSTAASAATAPRAGPSACSNPSPSWSS